MTMVKRMITQIPSLSSVAVRGRPEDPFRPRFRRDATTTPRLHHRSFRVHVRCRDPGGRLWTAMFRGVRGYSTGGGYSLWWSDGGVHHRRPADVLEVTRDVVCLRFAHTDHVLFLTGLNRRSHHFLAFLQRGIGDDTSRWVTEGSRRDRVLQIVGTSISIQHNFSSGPPQPGYHINFVQC